MLRAPSNNINLICFDNSFRKENEKQNVDKSELHLSTANHTDFMSESDDATLHKQFIEAVNHLETVATQPYTREIVRAVQVLKVRDRER